jgi:heterotetrameric sarcosine oxidase delta subunit
MLLVPCPNCGPRNATDFGYIGESPTRPDPAATTETEWRDYLYLRDNPAGWLTETWYCRQGCQRFITLERHTVTNQFRNPPLQPSGEGGPR